MKKNATTAAARASMPNRIRNAIMIVRLVIRFGFASFVGCLLEP
jgi:hypothetical protein